MLYHVLGLIMALFITWIVTWNRKEIARWRLADRIFTLVVFGILLVIYSGMALGVFN